MFEMLIANHCAPALAGIKPANIVTCGKSDFEDVHKEVKKMNKALNLRGIYSEILFESSKNVLVMVYRKNVLEKHLKNPLNNAFLSLYGYKNAEKLQEYINILKKRLQNESFPHEIGVFLGYPLHDIYCFIHHPKEGCLLVGDWKVYHNVEQANKVFCRFKACKRAVMKKVANGRTLAQIFCA